MKTDRLYRLRKEDSEKLSQLLTECFYQDPLYCQLIPEEEMRNKLLPELFHCDLDEMFENCEVYADCDDVNGIIVVSDETEPYNPMKYYLSTFLAWMKTVTLLVRDDPSLRTLRNFIRGSDYFNESWTDRISQKRRMHVIYFAVRPSMRGNGLATKLMSAVLDYADENHIVTSLETHNENNLRLYEHYGFHLFETLQKHFALKQYCLVR